MRLKSLTLKLSPKLDAAKRAGVRRMMEAAEGDDALASGLDQNVPDATAGDPDDALHTGFMTACTPLLSDALRGDTAALARLNKLVKAHAKLSSDDGAGDDEDAAGDDAGLPKPAMSGVEGRTPRPPARGRPIPERRTGATMSDDEFLRRLNR